MTTRPLRGPSSAITFWVRPRAVAEFIDRISRLSRDRAEQEKAVLLERKRVDQPGADEVESFDSRYYSELVRREQYDVDGQAVRT